MGFSVSEQDQAGEAMEVFNELMDSEVSIIVSHVSDIVHFCLEVRADCLHYIFPSQFCILNFILTLELTNNVRYLKLSGPYRRHLTINVCLCQVGSDTTLNDSVRVKAFSCIAFLIKLKSKVKSPLNYYK